ncbi:MAG: hypothetical protein P9X22_04305 [Candidatus Zapsychrus exili]|nr:hypothetical protein [Candidatus Zapsychrus exili]
MKRVIFRKKKNYEKGTKELSIIQKMEDKECITHVRKGFLYNVSETKKIEGQTDTPQIYITKSFDTKKQIERVNLRCVGDFYMTHNRVVLNVSFQHTLNIQIFWKKNIFSPKKSAILT